MHCLYVCLFVCLFVCICVCHACMVVDIFLNELGLVSSNICVFVYLYSISHLLTFTRLDFDISQPVMSCYHFILAGNQLTFLWLLYDYDVIQ